MSEDENRVLSDKISTEETRCQHFENFIKHNETEIKKVKEEFNVIKSECRDLQVSNDQLKCDVSSQEKIIQSLSEDLEFQRNKNIDMSTKKAQLENEIDSFNAQNKNFMATEMYLKEKLGASETKIQQYVNEIANFEEKTSKLLKDQCRLEKENSQINLTLQKVLNDLKEKKRNQNDIDQLKSNDAINDHCFQKINEDNEAYKAQIDFLNSVIVEMQKKNETLLYKIEILEMGVSSVEAVGVNILEKKVCAQRMFCDICDQFDLHETENCHMQSRDFKEIKPPSKSNKRPYCENCEMFGHETSSCDDAETF